MRRPLRDTFVEAAGSRGRFSGVFADCVAFRLMDGGGMIKFASDLAVAKQPNTLLLFAFFLADRNFS